MVNELVLGRIAPWCSFLMLFDFFSDRSSWVRDRFKAPDTVTDAGIYNVVDSASGVVALLALAIALNARPRLH